MRAIALLLGLALVACARGHENAPPAPSSAIDAIAPSLDAAIASSDGGSADAAIDAGALRTDPPGTYLGRVPAAPMSYEGAWWLERKDREAKQRPEHVLDVIGVARGQSVADIGCGSGYFTVRIAKRVGTEGRVYATDVQPEMLALLAKKIESEKLTNVVPLLATATDAKLPASSIDIALLVDVYHELARPDLTMAAIAKALRPGGKLVLVEYRAEDPKVDIRPEHKMTLDGLKREIDSVHYAFISSDESLPEQRIVTFRPR